MTAQDAFAIAFNDEAWAMDAMPGNDMPKNSLPDKASAPSGLKKNAAAAPGADKPIGGETSLAEHLKVCKAKTPESCPKRKKFAQEIAESQGISIEDAFKQVDAAHAQRGVAPQGMAPDAPQPLTPEQIDAGVNQIAENPQAINQVPNAPLPQDEVIETSKGKIVVQDIDQKAIVTKLEKDASSGVAEAEEGLQALVDAQKDGTITTGEQPPTKSEGAEESAQEEGEQTQPQGKGETTAPAEEQPKMTFSSKGGMFKDFTPDAEQTAIMEADPSKKEVFQNLIDLEEKFQNSKDPTEQEELNESIKSWKRMFYNNDTPPASETPEPQPEPAEEIPEEDGKHIDTLVPPTYRTEAREPSRDDDGGGGGPDDPNQPNNPHQSAPPDEEFRVGKDKYKIGDVVYTDVSGKGLLRSMFASMLAGWRGEGIITGWDRITGAWDEIKRSEAGERVRDGITAALLRNGIEKYANKEGLSEDARMELSIIQDMMEQAESPAEKMKALKQFQKWKEDHSKELGEVNGDIPKGNFSGLAQKGKGWQAPPASILPPVPNDQRDTSFMEQKKQQILDQLQDYGIGAEIVESINGSSVVQFKIRRNAKGTNKALQDAMAALEPEIGSKITYTPDTTSGEERMGTITINNNKVKDAGLRRLLEDQEARKAAEKMAAPLLLGETADGKAIWADASEHGFLGGDSGSGKSERIIGMAAGAFAIKPPSELQVVFNAHANAADYEVFEDDPHCGGIGKSLDEVAQNLSNANAEWKRRQKLFQSMGYRNLKEYNDAMKAQGKPEAVLPQIVVITDEVTNLLQEKPDLADQIRGIITNGRKFGVCHIGATQDMKATNMPTDIKGSLRMGVQSTKKEAPRAIFDAHTDELGKINKKGDIMYRDKNGNLVRLRGTYADNDTKQRLVDYNTGKLKSQTEASLPKEYTDGITQAVQNKQPISVQAIEGMEEAFKNSFPDGWTVENEKVDGESYWKAVPPKPTRVDESEAQKPGAALEEDATTEGDWTSATNRQEAIDTLTKVRDKAKAKAFEEYKKSKKSAADKTKYHKAIEKAEADFHEELSIVDSQFPSQMEDGDNLDVEEPQEKAEEETSESNDDDTPEQLINRARNRLKTERDKINKARDAGKISEREAIKRKGELSKRFEAAEAKFKAGGSMEEILNELEPEAKPEEPAKSETSSTAQENMVDAASDAEIDAEAAGAQEEEKKNERLRSSVPPQKGYSEKTIAGSFEATERLTPKEQTSIKEKFLPDGWDYVTDNGFKAPAKNQFGVIFVHDPKTGSQGRLIPNPKNPKSYKFQKDIDTTHPDFKGYVKNAQGEWELSPEAKKVEEETRLDRKQSRDPKKREEALKRFNRARFGHDEAPDNLTIVANAVADALAKIGD